MFARESGDGVGRLRRVGTKYRRKWPWRPQHLQGVHDFQAVCLCGAQNSQTGRKECLLPEFLFLSSNPPCCLLILGSLPAVRQFRS